MQKTSTNNRFNTSAIALLGITLFVLLFSPLRLWDLERAPFRSDEINQWSVVQRGVSLVEIWQNPPWMNQIPVAESLAIVSARVLPILERPEMVRVPFALVGLATLWLCGWGVWRRWGWLTALLSITWMTFNPFHLYESREAYYYVLLMFFSAGTVFSWLNCVERIQLDKRYPRKPLLWWALWLLLACHMHLSFWMFAAVQWGLLLTIAVKQLTADQRSAFYRDFGIASLVLAALMARWIIRAVQEALSVEERGGHIGGELAWVLSRLLPFFAGGANWFGWLLVALAIGAFIVVARARWRTDQAIRNLTLLFLVGLLGGVAYVSLVGGGAAKVVYFSSYWPLFIIWCSVMIVHALKHLIPSSRVSGAVITGFAVILAGAFWLPAWHIIHLDGKPTPYRLLQAQLDEVLAPGSVVVVDRWFEPWNEMATHATTNVHVTFTVPDEPYEAYLQNRWREVTRRYIEEGRAQGFLRLTKNHWRREGIWEWPASYFSQHAVIKNTPGLWLRERGFVSVTDFHEPMTNRLVIDLFFDLPEDQVQRKQAQGHQTWIRYGQGWGYLKPWQQTGNFSEEYRVLDHSAYLHLYNFADAPMEVELLVQGAAVPSQRRVRIDNRTLWTFPAQQFAEQRKRITLSPGESIITIGGGEPVNGAQLFVRHIGIEPVLIDEPRMR